MFKLWPRTASRMWWRVLGNWILQPSIHAATWSTLTGGLLELLSETGRNNQFYATVTGKIFTHSRDCVKKPFFISTRSENRISGSGWVSLAKIGIKRQSWNLILLWINGSTLYQAIVSLFLPFVQKLNYPDLVRWDAQHQNDIFFSQSAILHSMYYWVQIQVHRRFIPRPGQNPTISFPSLAICANAARSCIRVVETYLKQRFLEFGHFMVCILKYSPEKYWLGFSTLYLAPRWSLL